jgi:hypothetical protein
MGETILHAKPTTEFTNNLTRSTGKKTITCSMDGRRNMNLSCKPRTPEEDRGIAYLLSSTKIKV